MMKILEKGYKIDLGMIEEGFLYSEMVCSASNRNEARWKLLDQLKYDGMKLRSGDVVTYLNIPIQRDDRFDIISFEGDLKKRYEIDYILQKRERRQSFQSIIDDPNITHCYILKGGSYYRPDACGYTGMVTRAGVYEKNDAVNQGIGCDELRIIPINKEEHNKILLREIEEIKSRLL